MKWDKKKTGFTIVELLIVVVVIAILAAITIVAYNGIQNRAKESALQTTSAQVGKKVLTYATLNDDFYPTEASFRTDLVLPATDTATAVYDYYTSDDRKSFCLSVSDTSGSTVRASAFTHLGKNIQGRCIKNLVINPSFEVNSNGWSQANGAVVSLVNSTAALTGVNGVQITTSNASDSGIGRSFTYEIGKTYTFSCMIQSKAATAYTYKVSAQGSGVPLAGTVTRILAQDQQARVASTWTTTATVTGMYYCLRAGGQSGTTNFNVDGFMLTETDRMYTYGDGNREGWSWTGVANASASFGPSLPEN